MSILDVILTNPDPIIGGLTALLSAIGVSRWRKTTRAATVAEVDRWATVAVAVVVAAVKNGVFNDNAAAVSSFLTRFRKLAAAAGVVIKPEHEARAVLIAQEKLAEAINIVGDVSAARLSAVSDALLDDLARSPTVKSKAYRGGLGANVTVVDPHTGEKTVTTIPPEGRERP
jgi:hypothetical protein